MAHKKNKSMGFCQTGKGVMKDDEKVKSTTTSNPDGSYTETRTKGGRTGSSTYKKESKDSNVYVNENNQKRTFTKVKAKES